MKSIPHTHVEFTDPFFAPRQRINREITIPSQLAILKRTGRIDAWDKVGTWNPNDFFTPHRFWDSDVAKWMEAAAYSIHAHPDKALEAGMDHIITKMARAQMPDGYLNSHYQSVKPGQRWTNLTHDHELYCAGHLLEAAVAHHAATGKKSFLNVMTRYVHHIEKQFTQTASHSAASDGHEEIELALVKLANHTNNKRYLRLAQHFVEVRGRGRSVLGHNPEDSARHFYDVEARRRGEDPKKYWAKSYEYVQAHKPVRDHDEIVGHAVRATYLYTAVADLARELGDEGYLRVCERVWRHLFAKRAYITGGLGVSAANEGFTQDYDLPDHGAYAETCASIGLVFWAQRMLNITGDARYADEMERMLYNNIPAGWSLDGTQYFYENPLASLGSHHRQDWFDCACCPPNIARLFASLGAYAASEDDDSIAIHLLAAAHIGAKHATLAVTGRYPWDGRVAVELVDVLDRSAFALRIRVPGWCTGARAYVNGRQVSVAADLVNGYLTIKRKWKAGDQVQLSLPMPVTRMFAHPNVRSTAGHVALMRGPVVYCVEGVDHPGARLDALTLAAKGRIRVQNDADLGGIVRLATDGIHDDPADWASSLYRPAAPQTQSRTITAVPYAVWDNRQPGEMRVWMRAA